MVQSSLRVKPRKRIGKNGAREIRKEGNIPAILYGLGENSLPLIVKPDELKKALSNDAGINTVLQLEIEGSKSRGKKFSMLKEVQKDSLKNRVIHLDFLAIDMKKNVRVKVPINTFGRSEGERKGGRLEKLLRNLDIECLPNDIPNSIEIDVTNLNIGDYIDIANLGLGEELKPLRSGDVKVVHVLSERSAAMETEEEIEEEEQQQEPESQE